MANSKPFLTTNDLVNAVELTMSFPISQNSYTYDDIVTFLNQEMLLNAVPTLIEERQEYLVHRREHPFIANIGRYPISERAIAMSLRDVKYVDTSGQFYDLVRTAPDDKAYNQNTAVVANGNIGKFYLEGNDLVFVSTTFPDIEGSVMQFFYIRPNNLVRNDRAAIIEGFRKQITVIDNSDFVVGDQIGFSINTQTTTPVSATLTLVASSPSTGEFELGADENVTAANIANAINALNVGLSANSELAIVDVEFLNISTTITTTATSDAIDVYEDYIDIKFDQLDTSYTNPVNDETSTLYQANGLVDFLQMNPGHKIFTYDVTLLAIDGVYGKFNVEELQTYAYNSSGNGTKTFFQIVVGDYICPRYESIVPYLPPELHHALAERAAARIMMGSGDREGYALSMTKIQEMNKGQQTLIGNRVESSPNKVFNRNSLLRLGKLGTRRRY